MAFPKWNKHHWCYSKKKKFFCIDRQTQFLRQCVHHVSVHHVWLWGSCHKHLQARTFFFFIHFSVYFSYYKSGNLKINEINISLCRRLSWWISVCLAIRKWIQSFLRHVNMLHLNIIWSFLLNRKLRKYLSLHLRLITTAQERFSAMVLIDCSSISLILWWWLVMSPNRTQTKVSGLMVAVATVTGEVVLATALTFAAFFSDLSVVPGLIQSSYPSSGDHNRIRSTAVLRLRYFDINGHPELSFCYFSHFNF